MTTVPYRTPRTNIPDEAFRGHRALNVQSYIESNIKLGNQWYIQHQAPSIAPAGLWKIHFRSGSKQVLIKSREFYASAESASIQIFKNPTSVTGGTSVTIHNFNDVNPNIAESAVTAGVTTVSNGTPWGDPQHIYGQAGTGQRTGSLLAPGGDRILKPNTSYLVVIANNGTGAVLADYFLTWFEGPGDLPLAEISNE